MLQTPDSMFSYLIERVRNNLHVILCMSPVGELFRYVGAEPCSSCTPLTQAFPHRQRLLQYPALVNCTTIDWFCEWPRDALLEVAERFLDGLDLGSTEGVRNPRYTRTLLFLC